MATYTIADDQPTLTTANTQVNGLAAHHVGAKPGASVGLEVIDFLCLAYNDTDTQRVGLSRITPTTPVAQTPEKFNTHSAASAAVAMEDSAAGGWSNDPVQIICVGCRNSSTTGTHMFRRGWTRPNPRQGLFCKSGESTYMTLWIHMIAGATAYDGAWDSHITFAEDQAEVSYNRSAYRRRGHGLARAGYYHAKDSKIGFNGLSTAHHGLKDMQPDHAVLQGLDWPDSVGPDAAQFNLLLNGSVGQTVAVTQVQENDTANAIAWAPKNRLVTQVTENDTAQAMTVRRTYLLTQVQENDTAFGMTARKAKVTTQVQENDTAQAMAWAPKNRLVAQVIENDTAQTITPIKGGQVVAITQVVENDTAQAIAWAPKNRLVAMVQENDTAQVITPVKGGAPPTVFPYHPIYRPRRRRS